MKSINTWGFYFLPPFAFVILAVTSGQAAKIGVESRKCLTMSLIYQEAAVKLELCVIQGELGGPEACERGGGGDGGGGGSCPGTMTSPPRARREARRQHELSSFAGTLLAEWEPLAG